MLSGAWNRAIFTPEWARDRLFDGATPEVEVSFPILAVRLRGPRAGLVVQNGRVEAVPRDASLESLTRAAELATLILDLLRETPLQAMGINFRFTGQALREPAAAHLVALRDLAGADIAVRFTRPATTGAQLTMVLSPLAQGAVADLNYNWELKSAHDAASRLKSLYLASLVKDAREQVLRLYAGDS